MRLGDDLVSHEDGAFQHKQSRTGDSAGIDRRVHPYGAAARLDSEYRAGESKAEQERQRMTERSQAGHGNLP